MNTTIYLIRHSIRFDMKDIIKNNTKQSNTIQNEKIILSVDGEKRAEELANMEELQNIDAVYTSYSVRTLQTAKYLLKKQNLKVTIDDRLDERRIGITNEEEVPDWFKKQYWDENYKTEGGESQKDVRERFEEAFNEIIEENKGKRVAVFSHGYAITFFLMKWIKYKGIVDENKIWFEKDGKTFIKKQINMPEVFKLEINEKRELVKLENIEMEYSV